MFNQWLGNRLLVGLIFMGASGLAPAETKCAKLLPMPDDVRPFVEQVRAAMRAALRGKSESLVLAEFRSNSRDVPTNYCATGGQSPVAIEIEASFVGTVAIDDGKRAMGVIDLRRKEIEEIQKIPPPPEIEAELERIKAERAELDAQTKDVTNRNDPRYQTVQAQRYELVLKRERALKPHTDVLRAQAAQVEEKYGPEIRQLQYEPRLTLTLTANGWDKQEAPWMLLGNRGRTTPQTTRVHKIAVELSGGSGSPEARQRIEVLALQVLEKGRLQLMVEGKIPPLAESNALIAGQADDMKTGMAAKRETDKLRVAEESKTRAALQAVRVVRPAGAPAAAAAAAATPANPQPTPAAAPAAVSARETQTAAVPAVAPPPLAPAPAPAPNINPAAILDGVNRLKGLFGR